MFPGVPAGRDRPGAQGEEGGGGAEAETREHFISRIFMKNDGYLWTHALFILQKKSCSSALGPTLDYTDSKPP